MFWRTLGLLRLPPDVVESVGEGGDVTIGLDDRPICCTGMGIESLSSVNDLLRLHTGREVMGALLLAPPPNMGVIFVWMSIVGNLEGEGDGSNAIGLGVPVVF